MYIFELNLMMSSVIYLLSVVLVMGLKATFIEVNSPDSIFCPYFDFFLIVTMYLGEKNRKTSLLSIS